MLAKPGDAQGVGLRGIVVRQFALLA